MPHSNITHCPLTVTENKWLIELITTAHCSQIVNNGKVNWWIIIPQLTKLTLCFKTKNYWRLLISWHRNWWRSNSTNGMWIAEQVNNVIHFMKSNNSVVSLWKLQATSLVRALVWMHLLLKYFHKIQGLSEKYPTLGRENKVLYLGGYNTKSPSK
jgi:hypothetical protein